MILRMGKRGMWMAYAVAVLAIAGYGVAGLRTSGGLSGAHSKEEQIRALSQENKELREDLDHRQQRIDKLTNDPGTQELEVRKRLKLVKPHETVYILQDGKAEAKK